MKRPPSCPSCRHPRAGLILFKTLSREAIRMGFEVAKALHAPAQVSEFWRCAMCGSQFDGV